MRKTKLVTIEAENRDQGKQFLITEMAPSQAEKWAARVFFALARSGVDIPDEVADMGMAGMLVVGLKALGGISWELAEPLLDEMFECVTVPTKLMPQGRKLTESDIEEVITRLKLRKEILELHLGFSLAATPSISEEVTAQPLQTAVNAPISKMFPGVSQ